MRLTVFLSAAALLLAGAAQAQTDFSFGPRLGLTSGRAANPVFNGFFEHQRLLLGGQLGLAAQWQRGAWALRPALQYTQKGSRERTEYVLTNANGQPTERRRITSVQRFNYLELPLHLAYAPAWARGAQLLAGPYLGVGVGGRLESEDVPLEGSGNTYRHKQPVTYPSLISNSGDARLLDWGLDAGLGYQTGPLLVQAQYSWGLRNVRTGIGIPEYRVYLRTGSVSLTYLFGRRS